MYFQYVYEKFAVEIIFRSANAAYDTMQQIGY